MIKTIYLDRNNNQIDVKDLNNDWSKKILLGEIPLENLVSLILWVTTQRTEESRQAIDGIFTILSYYMSCDGTIKWRTKDWSTVGKANNEFLEIIMGWDNGPSDDNATNYSQGG